MDFTVPADDMVKLKESEKWDMYQDLAKEIKNTMEHVSDSDINCNWSTRYSQQWIVTGTGGLGNKMTSGDHPIYSIVEISQNSKKSPGDLRGLAVTQTPVESHQLSKE